MQRSDRRRLAAALLLLAPGAGDGVQLAKAGVPVGIGTLWRFFERRRMTWKKRRRAPPSRTARTS